MEIVSCKECGKLFNFIRGQQVRVTVDNCDRIMRTIDFTLADSDEN